MNFPELPRPATEEIVREQHKNHEVLPLTFIPINDYTTFRAEFAITDGDIVFHFFKTPEVEKLGDPARVRQYWGDVFASVLEPVAKTIFNADVPRLKAQHIFDEDAPYSRQHPLDSWWFRAYGFGHLLDPHAIAYRFAEALDASLDAWMSK